MRQTRGEITVENGVNSQNIVAVRIVEVSFVGDVVKVR